jgi:aminoglycoside 3-N-acetyltransferase
MMGFVLSKLSNSRKAQLKSLTLKSKRLFTKWFRSYGPRELEGALRAVGIAAGDTVMLHAAFASSGFRGSPKDLADVFLQVIGPTGNLLMVSMPYSSSTHDYLLEKKTFDVRKTPSHMGMVSEMFRRREGVLRSFSPSHPVLALGPKAEWIVADHDKCLYPCGPGSPFEKLWQLGGKVVVFHVHYPTITFVHYAEHSVEKLLPFALYSETFEVPSVNSNGDLQLVKVRPFSPEAVRRRRPLMIMEELEKQQLTKRTKVGSSRILCLPTRESLACTEQMVREGRLYYDLS